MVDQRKMKGVSLLYAPSVSLLHAQRLQHREILTMILPFSDLLSSSPPVRNHSEKKNQVCKIHKQATTEFLSMVIFSKC